MQRAWINFYELDLPMRIIVIHTYQYWYKYRSYISRCFLIPLLFSIYLHFIDIKTGRFWATILFLCLRPIKHVPEKQRTRITQPPYMTKLSDRNIINFYDGRTWEITMKDCFQLNWNYVFSQCITIIWKMCLVKKP